MSSGIPLDSEVLRQIPELRKQGLSFYKIAERLGIGESTARKHQNYRATTAKPLDQYAFTDRQLEIAIAASKKNARK
jgi:DNA-binding NarL/FixJ family response regulator